MSTLPPLDKPLSLDVLRSLGTTNGLYTVLFGWLLGMSVSFLPYATRPVLKEFPSDLAALLRRDHRASCS